MKNLKGKYTNTAQLNVEVKDLQVRLLTEQVDSLKRQRDMYERAYLAVVNRLVSEERQNVTDEVTPIYVTK